MYIKAACSHFFVAKVVPSRYMQAAQAKASVSVLMDKVNTCTIISLLKKKTTQILCLRLTVKHKHNE